MKKLLLLSTAVLVFGASLAHAQGGINFAWNNCFSIGTAAADIAYACDGSRDGAPFKAVISIVPSLNMDAYVGCLPIVDAQVADPTLPDWWQLGPGACRDGNLNVATSFAGIGTGSTGACQNPYLGAGGTTGGYLYIPQVNGHVNRGRITCTFVRDTPTPLISGQQYVVLILTFDNFGDIDTGTGVCAGCSVPACIVVNQVEVDQTANTPPQDVFILTAAATRSYVTWQGGAIGGAGCPTAVPARNVTWGSIKAVYR